MSMPSPVSSFTVDEYLAFERESLERHIFLDGEVFALAGESPEHGDITQNIAGLLYNALKGTSCRSRFKDTKVRSGPTPHQGKSKAGLFSYADFVVICGEPEYLDGHRDVVTNPVAILEVLFDSTEAFDRGEKYKRYQAYNPTLIDHVLVSQNEPSIEVFTRQADGTWSNRLEKGLDAAITVASIRCTLKLSDVYERVSFE